ncbi:MAG: sugar ABC transporter ATP-binding protein [Pseudomonadota bacterium]
MSHPIVSIRHVTKAFGANLAVSNASLSLAPGRVHALMGENGAGKSTLMKILAGVHRPDEGAITLNGRPVSFQTPKQALDAGISTVFQELSLLPNLSIRENMFLGKERTGRFGTLDRAAMDREAGAALAELGLPLDPRVQVSDLTIAERQFVEIAHGIKADADVFILDEPTAALNAADVAVLNRQIRKLRSEGKAVVYISHRMEEVFDICDDVTVMKDGQVVATQALCDLTPEKLIALMVGRELSDLFPQRARSTGAARLICEDLKIGPESAPIRFELHSGEIVGLAGLEGQGQHEVVRSFIGQHEAHSGTLRVGDAAFTLPLAESDGVRLLQSAGAGFVPEDRKEEGLLLNASIRDNIGISLQAARPACSVLAKLKGVVSETMARLTVKAASPAIAVGTLSGGNQQKVLLGRYLASDLDVLIVEEPTRGVDIGAKAEIYKILRDLADGGKAILVLSRETIELIGLCDRLLVIHAERIVQEMAGAEATEHAILEAALTS